MLGTPETDGKAEADPRWERVQALCEACKQRVSGVAELPTMDELLEQETDPEAEVRRGMVWEVGC